MPTRRPRRERPAGRRRAPGRPSSPIQSDAVPEPSSHRQDRACRVVDRRNVDLAVGPVDRPRSVARRQARSRGRRGGWNSIDSPPARSGSKNTFRWSSAPRKNRRSRSSTSRKSSNAIVALLLQAAGTRGRTRLGFGGAAARLRRVIAAAQRHLRRQGRRAAPRSARREIPGRAPRGRYCRRASFGAQQLAEFGDDDRRRRIDLARRHRGLCRRVRDCRRTSAARPAGRGRRDRRVAAHLGVCRRDRGVELAGAKQRAGCLRVSGIGGVSFMCATPGAAISVTSRNVAVTSSS